VEVVLSGAPIEKLDIAQVTGWWLNKGSKGYPASKSEDEPLKKECSRQQNWGR
jgi:hypothetical protein